MKVKILNVNNEDKGKYNQLTVNFKNLNTGVVMATKVMSFTVPDVYAQLKDAAVDSVFDIKSEKNEKGYWEWKMATPSQEEETNVAKGSYAAKANTAGRVFETSAERHVRQKLIVRQSSLTAAVETLKSDHGELDPKDVIATAAKYEAWVYRDTPFEATPKKRATAAQAVLDMDDDILY